MSISGALHPDCLAQLRVKLHNAILIRNIEVAAHPGFLHHHSLQPSSAHQLPMQMFTLFCRQGYSW